MIKSEFKYFDDGKPMFKYFTYLELQEILKENNLLKTFKMDMIDVYDEEEFAFIPNVDSLDVSECQLVLQVKVVRFSQAPPNFTEMINITLEQWKRGKEL